MEIWEDVVGYEGLYQVSNIGRIKGVDRTVKRKNGGVLKIVGKFIKPIMSTNKYYTVRLWKNGIGSTKTVHSIVMLAFVGPRPEGYDICHNDGVKTNIQLSNLRYDTKSANSVDRIKHGNDQFGENGPRAKLTTEMVIDIKRRILNGDKSAAIKEHYPAVARQTIEKIKHGRTWSHVIL